MYRRLSTFKPCKANWIPFGCETFTVTFGMEKPETAEADIIAKIKCTGEHFILIFSWNDYRCFVASLQDSTEPRAKKLLPHKTFLIFDNGKTFNNAKKNHCAHESWLIKVMRVLDLIIFQNELLLLIRLGGFSLCICVFCEWAERALRSESRVEFIEYVLQYYERIYEIQKMVFSKYLFIWKYFLWAFKKYQTH